MTPVKKMLDETFPYVHVLGRDYYRRRSEEAFAFSAYVRSILLAFHATEAEALNFY